MKASLQFTKNEVDNIKKSLHEKSDALDDAVKGIEIVASVQHEIEHSIDYLENQTSLNNLRLDGVAEGNAETWADTEGNVGGHRGKRRHVGGHRGCNEQIINFGVEHLGKPSQR